MAHGGGTKKSKSSCCSPLPPAHKQQKVSRHSQYLPFHTGCCEAGQEALQVPGSDLLCWWQWGPHAGSKDRPTDTSVLPCSHEPLGGSLFSASQLIASS